MPHEVYEKENEIHTELISLLLQKDGSGAFFMDVHMLRNKNHKKLTQSQLCAFVVWISLFCVVHHLLATPKRDLFINRAAVKLNKGRKGGDGDAIKKKNEEEVFFTEKSCTRKDINALAFFPLRLIENYIPSFIRQWKERGKCQHLLWKIIAHCCSCLLQVLPTNV